MDAVVVGVRAGGVEMTPKKEVDKNEAASRNDLKYINGLLIRSWEYQVWLCM